MITKQKVRVVYRLNTQKEKDGKHPIFMRIFVDHKKSEVFTDQYVSEAHWDNNAKKVRSACKEADYINSYLDNLKAKVQNQFYELRSQGKEITSEQLKNQLLGIEEKLKHKTILEAFDYHNLKLSEQVKIGKVVAKTYTRYKITKNKVEAFIQYQYKKDNIPLPEMRLRFVTEFEHYLLTIDKLQSNTAHKYIKNLKKIMNMAVGLDWIPSNPFNLFKCSYVSTERDILNQEELDVIRHKKISIERLAEVRDVFIFCCYTGFAYSDVYQFERKAVIIGLDGEYWLLTNRQKTCTKENVPLLPIPLEIIEKYKDNEYCIKHNKLLPINSNQRYNAYLKEMADICGIKKHLTTHIARHTFATTVTLANGVPIETVSAMLGHNNIRTTQIYAKVVEQKVSDDMQQLREKLFAQSGQLKTKIG